jgi:hypothetical protein
MSATIERARQRADPHLGPRDVGLELLLACGIAYGVVYVIANDVIAAGMWDDYRPLDQAISELSGTSAPSKGFLLAMLPVFTLLVLGFGVGVWRAAGRNRKLRAVGAILMAQAALFPVWLLFPMTSREELAQGAGGISDIGHGILTAVAILLIVTQMGVGATALGKRFRYFSFAMAVTLLAAGAYVATTANEVAAGDPTPWMGLVERASYGAWLTWMAVLAIVLLRRSRRDLAVAVERQRTGSGGGPL